MSRVDGWLGQNVPESVMRDAAEWMVLLDSAECTATDRMAFAQWLAEDPVHKWGFEELSEVWARVQTLSDISHIIDQPNVTRLPGREAAERRLQAAPDAKRHREWSTLAAVGMIVLGVTVHFLSVTPSSLHETQVGEFREIALDDGSSVELNAMSSIEVRFDERRREIELGNGEAVFEVEPDARPFVVRTPLATLSAVGTQFAVHATPSLVEVSVLEGLVSVSPGGSMSMTNEVATDLLMRFTDEIALLGPGQRIELTRETQKFLSISPDNLDDELSWRQGEVVFRDRPLMSVLSEMRRYIGTPIFIGDPALNSLRVSGRFRTGDVEAFLRELSDHYGIVIERPDDRLVILRIHALSR